MKNFAVSVFISIIATCFFGCGGGGSGSSAQHLEPITFTVTKIVDDAAFPSSLAFAPTGELFYTELLSGKIRRVGTDNTLSNSIVAALPVVGTGNEGLLGLVVDPGYPSTPYIYAYYSVAHPSQNIVTRLTVVENQATKSDVLISAIPSGGHNGGRLAFGPDGLLYVSTGDSGVPDLAQDNSSLGGKILRITPNGQIPQNNPYTNSPVYASGFRNVFGLGFNGATGELFASDNGPSCDDELNLITAGGNYGWRLNQPCNDSNYIQPLIRINPPIAPTGLIASPTAVSSHFKDN